jgi:amino acid adenylation domain-containing protein
MQPSSSEKSKAVPSGWNGTAVPFPRDRSVLDFFLAQVSARPESIAVKEGLRLMTYRELDVQSNRVAGALRRRGLKLEETVMIFQPASCEFLSAVIGILKAGGTYFPVGTETPAKRMEFLSQDSGARFLLTMTGSFEPPANWPGTVLDLPEILEAAADPAEMIAGVPTDSRRTAYLLYTSGSTGQPKGVQVEHHSLTNFVCDYQRRFKLTPQDRASLLAYVAFDVSMSDIWPVLCAGGTLVVPPKGILSDPDGLIRWLAAEEVTFSFVPTGLIEILFSRHWPQQMKLRYLITGGDRLRVRPPKGLPFTVMNGYGPTESTVFGTFSVVQPDDGSGVPPPIGRPLDNVTAYVLNEQLQPLPVGEAGELYLGGEQLARGYLGRPELTRERFLPDPFAGKPDARIYRTGDWARWLPDGELDFLGRKDDQIQIRGYRVELGELEAILFAHAAVNQVCCVPYLVDGMPTGVVAHVVPNSGIENPAEILRVHLQSQVPEYMLPSQFIMHERLPLTPQGKADRAAMVSMNSRKKETVNTTVATDDGLEKALLRLWHNLLPDSVNASRKAMFSDLGGDSLYLVKLMLGVEEIIGRRLEASAFLVQPNFDGLCRIVKERLSGAEFQPVLTIRKHGSRQPIFFLYGHQGDISEYFNLAEALGDDQPIYGVRSPVIQDQSRLPHSIEQAATEALVWIRQIQPCGSLALAGYSWAGLLVFEITRQMALNDNGGCFAALIGTSAPIRTVNFGARLAHFVKCLPSSLWQLAPVDTNRLQRLIRWRETARDLINNNSAKATAPDWTTNPVSIHMMGLADKYQPPQKSEVTVDLFRESIKHWSNAHPLRAWETDYLPDGGWNHWTRRKNRVHWVAGDHWTMIKPPAVSDLAKAVRLAMDQYFKQPSSQTP